MVVLVILVLCNIGLTWYLLKVVKLLQNDWDIIKPQLIDDKDNKKIQYDGIMTAFRYIDDRLKKIPHEITVRNVLNIP
jgi:hypothetical protein